MRIEQVDVVTPERILRNARVEWDGGIISGIDSSGRPDTAGKANNHLLMPGLIDLHSDANEKAINPRPNAIFPMELALLELDKLYASCGITTIYHCAAFSNSRNKSRTIAKARDLIDTIVSLRPDFRCNVKTHARYDITSPAAIPVLQDLVRKGDVDLLSFMDHTPGQGQFATFQAFKDYFGRHHHMADDEVKAMVEKRKVDRKNIDEGKLVALAEECRKLSIPLASHDDDTDRKVAWAAALGMSISEFPVTREAARAAREKNIWVAMGSPNLVLGRSTNGNLTSRDAFKEGFLNIFCSDYSPMTLLHSIFTLNQQENVPIHEAVKLVSLNPARAAGMADDTGSIETGKRADLVLVDLNHRVPRVLKTYVQGREVYSSA